MSFPLQVLKFVCVLAKFIYHHSLKGKTIFWSYRAPCFGCFVSFFFFFLFWQNYVYVHPEHTKLLHMYCARTVDFPKHISFATHLSMAHPQEILHSWMSHSIGKYPILPGLGERRRALREDFCGYSTQIGVSTFEAHEYESALLHLCSHKRHQDWNLYCIFDSTIL